MESLGQAAEKVHEAFMGGPVGSCAEGSSGLYCIKTYMPHPGKETELEEALQEHWRGLRDAGLTAKPEAIFLRSKAGRVIEIFEWRDKEAMEEAHAHEGLKHTWDTITILSTLVPLASLGECSEEYAHFAMINPQAHQNMPTVCKIVAQKPYQGKEQATLAKMKEHDVQLRKMGFTTDRPVMHMRGDKQGHIVEVAEWRSEAKVKEAQQSQEVMGLWNQFNNLTENCRLCDLPDAKERYTLLSGLSL